MQHLGRFVLIMSLVVLLISATGQTLEPVLGALVVVLELDQFLEQVLGALAVVLELEQTPQQCNRN